MKIKKIYTAILKLIIIQFVMTTVTLTTLSAQTAQTGPGGPGINDSGTVDNLVEKPQVSFDTNMSLMLIATGIGFGVKQWKRKLTLSEV